MAHVVDHSLDFLPRDHFSRSALDFLDTPSDFGGPCLLVIRIALAFDAFQQPVSEMVSLVSG